MTLRPVHAAALALILALTGCSAPEFPRAAPGAAAAPAPEGATRPQPRPGEGAPAAPGGAARIAAAFDAATDAERAAARAAPAAGQELGRVVVSLGNPAEQGFWLRSALVDAPRPGTVRLASGAAAQVELLPAAGGGAQLSLSAFRALELGLTDLPEVTVLAR